MLFKICFHLFLHNGLLLPSIFVHFFHFLFTSQNNNHNKNSNLFSIFFFIDGSGGGQRGPTPFPWVRLVYELHSFICVHYFFHIIADIQIIIMAQIDKIPFHSPEGQELLQESEAFQTLLIRLFGKQENNTFCGIQSSALLLSSQHIGAKFPDPASQKDCSLDAAPYVEGNMFSFAETKAAMEEAKVDVEGCTMDQVYELFKQHGRKVQKYHADAVSLEQFRSSASKALSHKDSSCGVIVNYDEHDLQQDLTIHGHFSP